MNIKATKGTGRKFKYDCSHYGWEIYIPIIPKWFCLYIWDFSNVAKENNEEISKHMVALSYLELDAKKKLAI